ncbi:hypothetical protein PY650_30980 [Rhizobium calliandrae]|uniref:Uncharacterized protein n=1 Tax=Rhizobium calliandrae TaxID=1312182 RepID=A0ABT7KMU6_9HYPH|nr:hypothetical protein [Rhizobium calliandrae]MDL2409964.1 hypothetical protein [Rhizobium calliandrae]
MRQIALCIVAVVLFASPNAVAQSSLAETVDLLLKVCLAGGTSQDVQTQAKGDVAFTLKALADGDIGGSGGIAAKYAKSEWVGLQGGINSGISALQAEQADKARECLKPYMPGIVQAILQAK